MSTTIIHPHLVRRLQTSAAALDNPSDQNCTVTFTSPVVASPPQSMVINGVSYALCTGSFLYSNDPVTFPAKTNAKIKFSMSNNSTTGWQLYKFCLIGYPNGMDGIDGQVYADNNQKLTVNDNNQGATTQAFDYGILVINPTTKQYAGSDPRIINDGGGTSMN